MGEEPHAHASRLAADGAEAGLFVWRASSTRLDWAVLLRPDGGKDEILPVVLVASLALLDALGAAGPPAVACDLVWPSGIRINRGVVGGVGVTLAPGEVSEWAVLTATLRKRGEEGIEAGDRPDLTSLADEGFADVADRAILEAFARYFLVWMDRWEESGLAAIAPHWLQRARAEGQETVVMVGAELVAGEIGDLDERGSLVLETDSGKRILTLRTDSLAPPIGFQ